MGTQVGVGVSHHRNPRIAGQEAVRQALGRAGMERPDFVLLFATVGYDQPTIVKAVYEACGRAPLCGCSAEGTIVQDEPDESNFSVAVLVFRSDEIRFHHGMASGLRADSVAVGQQIGTTLKPLGDGQMLLLFPDGLHVNYDRFLAGLEGQLQLTQPLRIVGGFAGDNWQWKQTYQYCDDRVISDGIAWALVTGPVRIALGVNHGCLPIGGEHLVTRAEANTIYEIDHKPAFALLKEYLSEEELNDPIKMVNSLPFGVEAPSEMASYDEFIIRVISAHDETTGSVTIPTEIPTGTRIRITRRDYDKLVHGVGRLADQLKAQLGDAQPSLFLQFECAGRGKSFLRDQQRLQLLQNLQSQLPTAPWFGFYTYGELGPVGESNCYHNYTAVIAALY